MIDGVQFGVFDEWLQLPLDEPDESLARSLRQRFPDDPRPRKILKQMAQTLCTLRNQLAALSDETTTVFGAWLLLPPGGKTMDVDAAVFGALQAVPVGTTADEFVELLLDGAPLHQPIDLHDVATPLGTARVVRARTFRETFHGVEIAESIVVFWLPDDSDRAIVLRSLPMDDLVQAARVAPALTALAQTFEPMRGGVA